MSAKGDISAPDSGPRLHLVMCLGADFDSAYIPHLCRHYAPAVDSWNILLHSNDISEKGKGIIEEAARAIESSLTTVDTNSRLNTHPWRGEFGWLSKVSRLNDLIREMVPPGEWVMYVDADEFIESPNDLKSLLAQCSASQRKVMYGRMVDRFANDRKPHPIQDEDDLFIKMPHAEEYTKTALRAWDHKSCLMKYEGEPLLINCHDYSGQTWQDYRASGQPVLTIWHFKWVESTREKLQQRIASFQRQGMGWWRESAVSLKDIYQAKADSHKINPSLKNVHPYQGLEARSFWKSGLADGALPEVWRPKWGLQPEDRVVTFGSCFARHLGPALRARGFNWWETEAAPQNLSPENALHYGYGFFSCRTATITTPTALRQWVRWALDDEEPPDEQWSSGDRFIDPFRPSIEPGGFISRAELVASRQQTIDSLQRAILDADVFLFTLGMTESWVNDPGGWVYPACPGSIGGCFDPDRHRFWNLSFDEVRSALIEALERLWAVRPKLRVLLTVSPVPLTATASGDHALAATSYSKAILRAVAGELADSYSEIDYFPSYEIVTAPTFGDRMFEPNRRSVSAWGVARVMDAFFAAHGVDKPAESIEVPTASPVEGAGDCDDAWAEAFER